MGNAKLLVARRFGPFFVTQFLGALNDNLYKQAMILLIAFRAGSEGDSGMATALAGGLFILPFFLFSAVAGQLADRTDKTKLIKIVKAAEIAIMLLGVGAFIWGDARLLYAVLFLMGTHSAFFGPVKYSILPQHLAPAELMAGNAFVEMGTFLAILLGMIAGAALKDAPILLRYTIVGVAAIGFLSAQFVPSAPPAAPHLRLNWNPFTSLTSLARLIYRRESVFNSVLGISWYWFYGATVLSALPQFTQYFLYGREEVFTLLMVVFVVSVAAGSLLCMWLARGEIELGLVPLGAAGMSLFLADLFFRSYDGGSATQELVGWREFLANLDVAERWRILLDFGLAGISSSLFIVPLYALIQSRSDDESRSRVIAANNIINAIFMVVSAIITMILYRIGFNTVGVLFFVAILNFVVCCYVFSLVPEFVMRFVVWVLANTIYRLRYEGRQFVPATGGAVIVCNHVSFIDWFIITAACRRPVRFVMDHTIFKAPLAGTVFRLAKAIPIAPAKDDPTLKEQAFTRIAADLKDGCLVCIFPEGKICYDGKLDSFRPGVERILKNDPVPVIPIGLSGLWGSFFSRQKGRAMSGLPRPSRRVITVRVGAPLPPTTTATVLQGAVRSLLVE